MDFKKNYKPHLEKLGVSLNVFTDVAKFVDKNGQVDIFNFCVGLTRII